MRGLIACAVLALCSCKTWSTVAPTRVYGERVYVVADQRAYELDDATLHGSSVTGRVVDVWRIPSCSFEALDPEELARRCRATLLESEQANVTLQTSTLRYAQVRHVAVGRIVIGILVVAAAVLGVAHVAASTAD